VRAARASTTATTTTTKCWQTCFGPLNPPRTKSPCHPLRCHRERSRLGRYDTSVRPVVPTLSRFSARSQAGLAWLGLARLCVLHFSPRSPLPWSALALARSLRRAPVPARALGNGGGKSQRRLSTEDDAAVCLSVCLAGWLSPCDAAPSFRLPPSPSPSPSSSSSVPYARSLACSVGCFSRRELLRPPARPPDALTLRCRPSSVEQQQRVPAGFVSSEETVRELACSP
jgi:hypothetical protein